MYPEGTVFAPPRFCTPFITLMLKVQTVHQRIHTCGVLVCNCRSLILFYCIPLLHSINSTKIDPVPPPLSPFPARQTIMYRILLYGSAILNLIGRRHTLMTIVRTITIIIIDWLIDRLTDWSIDWLIDWFSEICWMLQSNPRGHKGEKKRLLEERQISWNIYGMFYTVYILLHVYTS